MKPVYSKIRKSDAQRRAQLWSYLRGTDLRDYDDEALSQTRQQVIGAQNNLASRLRRTRDIQDAFQAMLTRGMPNDLAREVLKMLYGEREIEYAIGKAY